MSILDFIDDERTTAIHLERKFSHSFPAAVASDHDYDDYFVADALSSRRLLASGLEVKTVCPAQCFHLKSVRI